MKKTIKILSFVLAITMSFLSLGVSVFADYDDWWKNPDESYYEDDGAWWWELGDDWYYSSVPSTHYDSDSKTFYLLKNPGDLCIYTDFFDGRFDWAPVAAPEDVEHIVFTKGCVGVDIGFNDLPKLKDVTFLGDVSRIINSFNNCPKLGKVVVYGSYDEGNPDRAGYISNSFNDCHSDGIVFYSDCSKDIPVKSYVGKLIYKSLSYSKNNIDNIKLTNTEKGVKISWDTNPNSTPISVKKYNNGKYEKVTKEFPETYLNSITDTSVKSGTVYYYWLNGGHSITYLSQPVITSCVSSASNKVTVKWKKVTGAKGYYVYRSTTGKKGSWTKIANLKSDKLSYTASGLKLNTKYYICVKAYSGSSVSCGATKTVTAGVPEITSAKKDGNNINLKWAKQNNAVYYKVYTRAPGESSYTTAKTIKDPKTTSCKIKTASKKGTVIKVRAFYKSGKKTVYGTTQAYTVK